MGEIQDTVRFHFQLDEEQLPTKLLQKYINNEHNRVVTMLRAYQKNTGDVSLTSGAYSLSGISDFYLFRWVEYDGAKLVRFPYENSRKAFTSDDIDYLKFYYIKDNAGTKTLNVIAGDDETVDIYYWAYPAALSTYSSTINLADEHSDVLVDRVCMQLAKSKAPQLYRQYAASYRDNFMDAKKYYIKKNTTNRGYVVPVDY